MSKSPSKEEQEKVKNFSDFQQSYPEQLTLFGLLGFDNNSKKYSNTIELYDFIPKYFWGKQPRIKVEKPRKNDKAPKEIFKEVLPHLERGFECRGVKYKLELIPASIKGKDGIERDFYPGKREELIEATLLKYTAEGQGLFLDELASVTFTIYQLQKDLKKQGHTYSKDEIKEALQICKRTNLIVTSEDGQTVLESNMFEMLGLQTQEDWKGAGEKTKCFVRFNPLVTRSINKKDFRLLNYEKSLALENVIARQLHKRMSHHFLQASLMNPYTITLLTMLRDFGITRQKSLSDNWRDVEIGLKELKAKEVILDYTKEIILDANRRNRIADVKVTITPHPRFIGDIVKGNERHKKVLGFLPPVKR